MIEWSEAFVMDVTSWGFAFTNWPTDWIVIGAVAMLIALDSLRSGRARASALALSLPATLLITSALPHAAFLGTLGATTSSVMQVVVFTGIFIAMYISAYRMIFSFSDGGGVIQSLVAGIAAAIILTVVWLLVPALHSIWHFGPQVQAVFGEAYRFWWLLASFAALAFVRS